MDTLGEEIASFTTTTSDETSPIVWYINGALTVDPTDLLFRTKDEVKNMLFKTLQDRYDDVNFDFCRIFHKQYDLLKEWIEEYIFLRDEAYDVFSRSPNEYNAMRLRQTSNYLDGFLEASRLFEMISSELEFVIKNNELSKVEVNILQKASQLGASESVRKSMEELLQRVDAIEKERKEHLYSGAVNFNVATQYTVSGTMGTITGDAMARTTVG